MPTVSSILRITCMQYKVNFFVAPKKWSYRLFQSNLHIFVKLLTFLKQPTEWLNIPKRSCHTWLIAVGLKEMSFSFLSKTFQRLVLLTYPGPCNTPTPSENLPPSPCVSFSVKSLAICLFILSLTYSVWLGPTITVSDQFPSVHIIILMRRQYANIYSRLAFLLQDISEKYRPLFLPNCVPQLKRVIHSWGAGVSVLAFLPHWDLLSETSSLQP